MRSAPAASRCFFSALEELLADMGRASPHDGLYDPKRLASQPEEQDLYHHRNSADHDEQTKRSSNGGPALYKAHRYTRSSTAVSLDASPYFAKHLLNELPIRLPTEKMLNAYIVAASQSGKTELLKLFAHSIITQGKEALICIEPAGDASGRSRFGRSAKIGSYTLTSRSTFRVRPPSTPSRYTASKQKTPRPPP